MLTVVQLQLQITITEPTVLAASAIATPLSCPTCADGAVSINSVQVEQLLTHTQTLLT
jgi:hypothetical protein